MVIGNFVYEIIIEMDVLIYIVYLKEIQVLIPLKFIFYREKIIFKVFYFKQRQILAKLMKLGNLV